MMKILTLPFRLIGWLIGLVFKLITALLAPVALLGGVGFLGYKYFESNPEALEKAKKTAMSKIKGE